MPSDASQTSLIPINQLVLRADVWPRFSADPDRIELFADQLRSGDELPPIEVVPHNDGKYLIADGAHRCHAAVRAGRNDVAAIILTPLPDEAPTSCAYRRALETATRSALPLTTAERRRAAVRLAQDSTLSHRAIGRLIGASHDSVGRWVRAEQTTVDDDQPSVPSYPTADDIARKFTAYMARMDDGRGLLDMLMPQRMGRHLASAFRDRFGTDALKEAQRISDWLDMTISALRTDGSAT